MYKMKNIYKIYLTNVQTYNINETIEAKYQKDRSFANLRGGELEKMSSEEVLEKVKGIIVEQLGVAENAVTMEASFRDDLGADSLDIVELVMALEEEFDIEIPDSDAEKVVTVGDVVDYIKENVK